MAFLFWKTINIEAPMNRRHLRVADLAILARLHRSEASGPVIQADVADAPKSPPTLSKWLNGLERDGLIRGRHGPLDGGGHGCLWSLTEAGAKAMEDARALLGARPPTTARPAPAATTGRDPATIEEYIKAGKETLLWLRRCLVAPPDKNRRIIIDRAIKRCHAALAALGEVPVDEE
jgi:DNA-binding PadR family transcriptional regulator